MADSLTTFTDFIIKPSATLAAGVVLFGVIWGFFKGVESVLNDDTKFEIAVWLVGVRVGQKVEPWPDTFAKVFDRVFGKRHLSWTCFFRSCFATLISCFICSVATFQIVYPHTVTWRVLLLSAVNAAGMLFVFDYLSLLTSRYLLSFMSVTKSLLLQFSILILGTSLSGGIGAVPSAVYFYPSYKRQIAQNEVRHRQEKKISVPPGGIAPPTNLQLTVDNEILLDEIIVEPTIFAVLWLPAFFTSIWLWLYAGSGFLLKGARHFDKSLGWFNRRFDIEKKPLQSIGLVAGALVALIYWAAVIVSRVV